MNDHLNKFNITSHSMDAFQSSHLPYTGNWTSNLSCYHGNDTIPPPNPTCSLYDFVVEAVFMGILCLLGFVGNSLSAVCLWKDRSKTATPFLLVSLEIADTSFLITVVGLRVLDSIQTFTESMPWIAYITPYMGKYLYPCAISAETGTIYLIILVTLNRFVSVCMPYDATNLCSIEHARKHVIIVWVFSFLVNAPRFFEYDIVFESFCDPTNSSNHLTAPNLKPTALLQNSIYHIVYLNILYFIVMFLVPLISLILLNTMLVVALRRTRKRRERMRNRLTGNNNGGGAGSRSEEDITFMLIVVVLVFVVSQTPALITQILRMMDELKWKSGSNLCPNYLFFYERISDLLIVANSSLNFIIYCFCSRRFRQILVELVRPRCLSPSTPSNKPPETHMGRSVADVGNAVVCQKGKGFNGNLSPLPKKTEVSTSLVSKIASNTKNDTKYELLNQENGQNGTKLEFAIEEQEFVV